MPETMIATTEPCPEHGHCGQTDMCVEHDGGYVHVLALRPAEPVERAISDDPTLRMTWREAREVYRAGGGHQHKTPARLIEDLSPVAADQSTPDLLIWCDSLLSLALHRGEGAHDREWKTDAEQCIHEIRAVLASAPKQPTGDADE